jgi:hypothetical protein
MNKMEKQLWMSTGLDTVKTFRNIHKIPIKQKWNINEMIYKEYLYSNGELFKIDENFETTRISDSEMFRTMKDSLFKRSRKS